MSLHVFVDGATARGAVSVGVSVQSGGLEIATARARLDGRRDSYEAEIAAAQRGLEEASRFTQGSIFLFTDCLAIKRLFHNQLLGANPKTAGGIEAVTALRRRFDSVQCRWLERDQNWRADFLAQSCLRGSGSLGILRVAPEVVEPIRAFRLDEVAHISDFLRRFKLLCRPDLIGPRVLDRFGAEREIIQAAEEAVDAGAAPPRLRAAIERLREWS